MKKNPNTIECPTLKYFSKNGRVFGLQFFSRNEVMSSKEDNSWGEQSIFPIVSEALMYWRIQERKLITDREQIKPSMIIAAEKHKNKKKGSEFIWER